jgi:3-methyladenine DNA glycosylase/8-oxoguanine DNA glycosylase
MPKKTGKNFKEVIKEQENKGKTRKAIMKRLTSIDSAVMYAGSFLLLFVALDAAIYLLLAPDVFVWAGSLIVSAVVSSLFAQRVTKTLKRLQWKYAAV